MAYKSQQNGNALKTKLSIKTAVSVSCRIWRGIEFQAVDQKGRRLARRVWCWFWEWRMGSAGGERREWDILV